MGTAVVQAPLATLPKLAADFAPAIPIRSRYDNWIGGQYAAPVRGNYFSNPTPITGQPLCEVARSTHEDVDKALDAAHAAAKSWNVTSPAHRDRRPHGGQPRDCSPRRDLDNGKPIRETMAADCRSPSITSATSPAHPRAGRRSPRSTRHRRLPLPRAARRRRPDHPVELPAPDGDLEARAGARRRQLRRAEAGRADAGLDHGADGAHRRPAPAGVLNVVNGFGVEAGKPLASEPAHRQDRLHRRDDDRPADHAVRVREPDPGDARARRQVAEHLLRRRAAEDDDFFDKALEGFAMFALNQGEVCTCPSRALVQESIYDRSWRRRSPA
jgi:aldehyde dehydrogenase